MPGEFIDPLQLASLIDLDELQGLHDFIRELGATELTFNSYCCDQVPAAFAGSDFPAAVTYEVPFINDQAKTG